MSFTLAKANFFFPLLVLFCLHTYSNESVDLSVAIVQFQITEDLLISSDVFWEKVDQAIIRALKQNEPYLVIFPEYLGALYPLSFYSSFWEGSQTFVQAFNQLNYNDQYEDIRSFYVQNSPLVYRDWLEKMGGLAKKHHVFLVGSTVFFFDQKSEQLTNRALIFNPDGELLYFQDKVYLTAFEKQIISLDRGAYDDARLFNIEDHKLALTICRDTYFAQWEGKFDQADIWVDIKANGEIFTPEVARIFLQGLPERIESTGVPLGVTACLTGSVFDLFWQGKSRVDAYGASHTANHADSFEILYSSYQGQE